METMNYVVDYKKKLVSLTLSIFLVGGLFGCVSNKIELKAKEFETPVNKELSVKAETYFKNTKKNGKVSFKNSKIDNKKLGTYDVILNYDSKEYKAKIKVVDKEKPVIKVNKEVFVFKLKDTLHDVNKAINKEIKVTDNYDMVFRDFDVFTSIPREEKEIVCKLNVKDTSKNVSDDIMIKVQFTKDGKEKKGLKQETINVGTTVNKVENEKMLASSKPDNTSKKKDGEKPSSSTKYDKTDKAKDNKKTNSDKEQANNNKPSNNNEPSNNGGSSNTGTNSENNENNNSSGNNSKPAPSEPPRPSEQPKPDKPVQKPQLTVANCPDWLSNGYTKIFATYNEAYEWANNQVRTEGSPYYGKTHITTVELSDDEFVGSVFGVDIS